MEGGAGLAFSKSISCCAVGRWKLSPHPAKQTDSNAVRSRMKSVWIFHSRSINNLYFGKLTSIPPHDYVQSTAILAGRYTYNLLNNQSSLPVNKTTIISSLLFACARIEISALSLVENYCYNYINTTPNPVPHIHIRLYKMELNHTYITVYTTNTTFEIPAA